MSSSITRSRAACDFCRIRKLRCDNGSPQCSSCRSRGIDCVYARREPKARPSKAAIEALQQENQRLRRLLGSSPELQRSDADAFAAAGEGADDDAAKDEHTDGSTVEHISPGGESSGYVKMQSDGGEEMSAPPLIRRPDPRPSLPPIQPYSPAQTTYHGPTSAHFDVDEPPGMDSEMVAPPKATWRETLVAFAAIERQRERLNHTSRAYDYDGWDPELVNHLLNIHWNRQHHNLLLIYRPLFMRDMARRGPYYSKLLLNALLFAASKFSPRTDIRRAPDKPSTAGWQFRQRVRDLLGEALEQSAIPTIQALITVASSLFAIGEAKSTAWLYTGIAFRMIIDLGLHVDREDLVKRGKITVEDLEVRRRVFWGAFIFDKIHSMYLGRPVTLQEAECQVPIELFDNLEELEQWTPLEQGNHIDPDYPMPKHPGATTYSVTANSAHCGLAVILNRILNHIYANTTFGNANSVQISNKDYCQVLEDLSGDLDAWVGVTETSIRYEPWRTPNPAILTRIPAPSVLSISCMFHLLLILLNRPFITRGHLLDYRVAPGCLRTCVLAAIRLACIIQHYCTAFTIRRSPYFISYCAYVASTILVRVVRHVPDDIPDGGALWDGLALLREFLRQSERTNAGVHRVNCVITGLVRRCGVDEARLEAPFQVDAELWQQPAVIPVDFVSERLDAILDSFTMLSAQSRRGDVSRPKSQVGMRDAHMADGTANSLLQANDVLDSTAPMFGVADGDVFHDSIFGFHGSADPFGDFPILYAQVDGLIGATGA